MVGVGVLNFAILQTVPPISYSTIPGTLVVKRPILFCKRLSVTNMGYKELVLLFLTGVGYDNSFFASRYPGLCHGSGACLFSSTLRK